MQQHAHKKTGYLAVIAASILWGTTGVAASFTPDVSPLATGAFAMGIAALLLVLTARTSLNKDRSALRQYKTLLFCGALAVFIYPLAFYSAMRLSGVAIGTLVSLAGAPLVAAILERLFSQKKLSLGWFIRFLIGASGVAILIQSKGQTTATPTLLVGLGVLLGVVAAISYACYAFITSKLVSCGVSSDAAVASLFGLAACGLLPSLFFSGDNLFASPLHISVALYMALLPMFVGYLCFGYGLRFLSSSQATLITLLEPAVATLLAVLIVGERFGLAGVTGLLLIAICLWLQILPQRQKISASLETVDG